MAFFDPRWHRLPGAIQVSFVAELLICLYGVWYRWRQASVRFRICSIWNRRGCVKGASMRKADQCHKEVWFIAAPWVIVGRRFEGKRWRKRSEEHTSELQSHVN